MQHIFKRWRCDPDWWTSQAHTIDDIRESKPPDGWEAKLVDLIGRGQVSVHTVTDDQLMLYRLDQQLAPPGLADQIREHYPRALLGITSRVVDATTKRTVIAFDLHGEFHHSVTVKHGCPVTATKVYPCHQIGRMLAEPHKYGKALLGDDVARYNESFPHPLPHFTITGGEVSMTISVGSGSLSGVFSDIGAP